mgnify:CR=1 FL=1
MLELKDLNKQKLADLVKICDDLSISNQGKKNEIIDRITEFYSKNDKSNNCLLYTSPSPRDQRGARMPA